MADTLKDFFVGIGFKLDTASQAKAESGAKRTEEKITKDAEKESQKRVKAEAKAAADREKQRKASAKSEDDRWKAMLAREKAADEKRAKTLKNFETAASKTASAVTGAFAAITAGAMGVVYAVDRAAKSFEKLNYTGMRSGASAGKVGAFGYAAGQLGSSKEEAEGQLQTFGQNLKLNSTGYGRALERLGIKTRDANGQLRDSVDLATDLGDALRKIEKKGPYGYANAMNQARVFGFEGDTARALMNPEFRKRAGQFGSDQSKIGADSDAAAKSGTAFEQSMRRLLEVLDQIGTKINGVLFVKLKPLLDQLSQWFLANGDKIADIIARVADELIKLATAIGQQLADADWKTIFDNIDSFAKSLGGLLGKLEGEKGLVAMIAALAIGLRAVSIVAMPPWVLALLGIGAAGAYGLGKLHEAAGAPDKNWDELKQEDAAASPQGGLRARGRKARLAREERHDIAGGILRPADPSYRGAKGGWWTPENQKHAYDRLVSGGMNPTAAIALISRWKNVESAGGPTSLNPKSGAFGIIQGLGKRKPRSANVDDQLDDVLKEYKTGSGDGAGPKASRVLAGAKSDAEGATGASAYERAEGYNPATGNDNFTQRTLDGMAEVRRNIEGPKKLPPMLRARSIPAMPDHVKLFPGETLGADGKTVVLTPQHTSMRGDTNVTHNPTYNIAGNDVRQNMEAARLSASRGQQDLLRNVQGTLA